MSLSDLPAVNATLNSISFVLLVTGYAFIRRGDRRKHKFCMVSALIVSARGFSHRDLERFSPKRQDAGSWIERRGWSA